MSSRTIPALARAILPVRARRFLRRLAREAPHRLRDLPKDVVSMISPRAFDGPMPPAGLRARVGLGSRAEFTLVGRQGAGHVLDALARFGAPGRAYADWLDLGCGCGRIARYLLESDTVASYSGVDVDLPQIAWAARHLAGRFSIMRPRPPLEFPDAAFDVVIAISVFTHFTEEEQFAWLSEIRRVLKPGGLLVATTIPPDAAPGFPGLTIEELSQLSLDGFLAIDHEAKTFNERLTFHSRAYLEKTWSETFEFLCHEARGFVRYQDFTVWAKPAG